MINRTIAGEFSRVRIERDDRIPPYHYVTRFVTFLLRGHIPRPRVRIPLSTSNKIHRQVLASKVAGVAKAITVKNSPRCAHGCCVGESIDKTLCIYGDVNRRKRRKGARCAIYLRLSMYVCLARYRATIISAHGRERTYVCMHSLSGPRMRL